MSININRYIFVILLFAFPLVCMMRTELEVRTVERQAAYRRRYIKTYEKMAKSLVGLPVELPSLRSKPITQAMKKVIAHKITQKKARLDALYDLRRGLQRRFQEEEPVVAPLPKEFPRPLPEVGNEWAP